MAAGFENGDGWIWGPEMRVLLTLIVFHHISEVVLPTIMCFPDAHGVVGKVDIAVVALGGDVSWVSLEVLARAEGNLQKSMGR